MSIQYDLHIPACYVVQISPPNVHDVHANVVSFQQHVSHILFVLHGIFCDCA